MEKDSKSLLSNLIKMVLADGKIAPAEVAFIKQLASRMGISPEETTKLLKDPQPSKPIYSEVDRITHFYKLMLVMRVDGETHKDELVVLKNFGLKMGIRPVVSEQILRKMDKYPQGILPPEELLDIFKIYYN